MRKINRSLDQTHNQHIPTSDIHYNHINRDLALKISPASISYITPQAPSEKKKINTRPRAT